MVPRHALPKRLVQRSPRTNARGPSLYLPSEQQERRFDLRNAKAEPASSQTALTREAKLVMVWTAEKLNEGIPERGSVSYSAAERCHSRYRQGAVAFRSASRPGGPSSRIP